MKSLLVLISLLSSVAFAQDGYHIMPKQTCSSDTCLFVDDSEIGFNSYLDLEGNEVKSLNTESSLLDMTISISNACFTGDNKEVEKILSALAGNTNAQYYRGGHAVVRDIAYAQSSESIVVAKVFYKSDYSSSQEVDYIVIKKCE